MKACVPLALLAFAPLTSCLELEAVIALHADGSGTQRLRMGLTERGQELARTFAKPRAAGAQSDPLRLFNARVVRRELLDAGLRCRNVKSYEARSRRFVEVDAEFTDLATLRKSPLLGGAAEWQLQRGPRPGLARLVFFPRGEAAWRQSFTEARRIAGRPTERETAYFERIRPEMRGMSVHWTLELPGQVVGHSKNLRALGDRRVQAVVTELDIRDPQSLVRQLAPRYEVVFDASECRLTFDPAPRTSPATPAAPGR